MRQAIVTKFLGPTNARGSRIKAKAAAGSFTVPWDYSLNPDENHAKAAEALVRKLGWTSDAAEGYAGAWVAGGLPTDDGNVFVYVAHTVVEADPENGFVGRIQPRRGDGFEV